MRCLFMLAGRISLRGGWVLKWQRFLLSVCLIFPGVVYGQQRPLQTDDAETLPVGRVRASVGAEFLQSQRYTLSGLQGDLIRLGVTAIHVGVGEYAEFQISGVLQDVLSISSRTEPVVPPTISGDSTNAFGNLILGTKLKFVGEKGNRPAIAFKFAVELPNTNQATGLGNDETEFYSSLLFKKHLGRSQILGELGFAILGSPIAAARQADPLTYGIAAIVPVHRSLNLVAEINGRQGPHGRIGNENKSQVRAGIQFRTGAIRWDLGGVAGLTHYDPKSGIVVGVTYEFQAFRRKALPIKIQH
jgi:hypothetical protein